MPRQVIYRVHTNSVYSYLKVQMVARGVPCRADICNSLALSYILALVNVEIATVTV